jgi:hypothetical protein
MRRLGDKIIGSLEEEYVRSLGGQRRGQFEGLMKEVSGILEMKNGEQD